MAETNDEGIDSFLVELSELYAKNVITGEQLIEAYGTLIKLGRNIIANPTDEKYRVIRKLNQALKSKLQLDREDHVSEIFTKLFQRFGFQELDDVYIYSSDDLATLSAHVELLDGVATSLAAVANRKSPSSSTNPPPVETPDPKQSSIALTASPSTTPPPKPNYSRNFCKRDNMFNKATTDVQTLREEQARRYRDQQQSQSYFGLAPFAPTSYASSHPSSSTTSSSSSGVSNFFSGLFGGGARARHTAARRDDGPRLRTKTLKDIQPPPGPSGGGG